MELLDFLIRVGGLPFALVALALLAGVRQLWVWGYQLRECQAEIERLREEYERRIVAVERARQRWEDLAWKGAHVAERSLETSARLAEKVGGPNGG